MRTRHTPSSDLTLRQPAGRGFDARSRIAFTTRFLVERSSRFSSRSARKVIVTLYIYLAVGAQFLDQLGEGSARLVPAFAGDLAEMQILKHLLVLFKRENDGCLLTFGVRDELNVS